jgi:hypothetical protein
VFPRFLLLFCASRMDGEIGPKSKYFQDRENTCFRRVRERVLAPLPKALGATGRGNQAGSSPDHGSQNGEGRIIDRLLSGAHARCLVAEGTKRPCRLVFLK